jgi:hypothetical protein
MKSSQKEDYRVLATISFDQTPENVPDVVCKVYLPKRTTENARLIFLPNDEQEKRLRAAHLVSVHAELRQPNGHLNVITSRQTLITTHKTFRWGPDLTEHLVPGEPWDLEIETVRQRREANEAQQMGVASGSQETNCYRMSQHDRFHTLAR